MSLDGRTTLDPPNHQQRMQAQSTERAHDVVAAAAADAAAAAAADEQQNVSLMAQTLNADGTPKRPMNAFMIFARKRRPQVSAQNQLLRTGEISKILSREWNTMVIHEKQQYLDLAKRLKDNFNAKYPDYVYRRRPNNSRRRRGRPEHRVGSVGPSHGGDDRPPDGHDLDDDDSHLDESDSPQPGHSDAHGPFHTQAHPHPTHILPTHTQTYYQSSLTPNTSTVLNGHQRSPLPSSSRQQPPHLYPVSHVPGPASSVSYSSSAPSPLSSHPHYPSHAQSHQGFPFNDRHMSSPWADARPPSSQPDPQSAHHFPLRTVSPANYPLSGHHSTVHSTSSHASSASPTSSTNPKLRLLATPFSPPGSEGSYAHATGEHIPSSAASSHSGSGPASTAHSPSTSSWPRAPERPASRVSPPSHSLATTPSPVTQTQLHPMTGPGEYSQPQLPPLAAAVPARVMGPPFDTYLYGAGDAYGRHYTNPLSSHLSSGYLPAQSSTGPQSAHSAAAMSFEGPWPSRDRLGGQRDAASSQPDGGAHGGGGGY